MRIIGVSVDDRLIRSLWAVFSRWAFHITILIILLFSPFLGAKTSAGTEGQGAQVSRGGQLFLTWGDGKQGSGLSTLIVVLVDEAGETTVLEVDTQSLGKIYGLNHRNVIVRGQWAEAPGLAKQVLHVNSIQLNEKNGLGAPSDLSAIALSGPQPWANVMCKFADITTEPKSLSYFNGLLSDTKPGLGHYWRENSYDQINILGSNSFGWYTLPKTRSYYLGLTTTAMLNELFTDCTAAADSDIYYPSFVGVNLMFNAELDGSAWGGTRYSTLDGQSRYWYSTWEPPWGYGNQTAMAHEMGHGFGLPHSSGEYGATYDNQWDVMSDIWNNCSRSTDPTYGCLGQHTISYHKDKLAWIPSGTRFTTTVGTHTITLEQLALPQTGNYRMAVIPIGGSSTHFYTVEVRRSAGYDVKLPGQAVIIHDVDITRGISAHVLDPDLNGTTGDAGAMWIVGETFSDETNEITVSIDSTVTSGFIVTITLGGIMPDTPTATWPATPTPETITATPTRTGTGTLLPPTSTPTASGTWTPPATATATPSSTPTTTYTPLPPTTTRTATATWTPPPSATPTPFPTSTATPSRTPTATATYTPLPPTATQTATATWTPPPSATSTPTFTSTATPSWTPTVTESPTPTATATNEFEPEDINQDGQVDKLDSQLCINVLLGTEMNPVIVTRADVNRDGKVNAIDVQLIVNKFQQAEAVTTLVQPTRRNHRR